MTRKKSRLSVRLSFFVVAAACLLSPLSSQAQGFTSVRDLEESQVSLKLPPPGVTGDEVFQKLVEHSGLRDHLLERYSVVDRYVVGNLTGKIYAQAVVQVRYHAPDKKTFTKKYEEGSWLVRVLVLNRLIESQEKTSSGRDHRDSSISPRNYSFKLLGEERVGPYACYVVRAIPRRKDRYLSEGKIWISKQDFGIVRIAGHPAQKLSFWIEKVDFVRQYEKFGLFWLPEKDETIAKIRWKGRKTLIIDHADYSINGLPDEAWVGHVLPSPRRDTGFQARSAGGRRLAARYPDSVLVEDNRTGGIR